MHSHRAIRRTFPVIFFVVALLLCQVFGARASQWARTYGGLGYDKAEAVSPTQDGGFIVAGWTESFGNRSADILLLKLDGSGHLKWQKLYEGPRADYAYDVHETRDGGYIIAGATNSFSANRETDILVIRTDAHGNILWQRRFATGEYKHAWAYAVRETSDGGFVVAGKVQSTPGGHSDLLVMKLSSSGAIEWQRPYSKKLEGHHSPDPTDEAAYDVCETNDGGFVVAGYTQFFGGGQMWRHHIWVLKLDGSGYLEWSKEFGSYSSFDEAHSVIQTSDGNYILSGIHQKTEQTDRNAWVIKLDADGGLLWSRFYGGPRNDGAYAVSESPDGGFIVAGWTESFGPTADLWLLKLSSSGEIEWQKAFGSDLHGDYAYDVKLLNDGGYVVAGQTYTATHDDFWILKLDHEGSIPSCTLIKDTEAQVFEGGDGTVRETKRYAEGVSPSECSLSVSEPEVRTNEQCFYEPPNEPPVIDSFTVEPDSGEAPLEVTILCQAHDPDGSITAYEVDFGDGSPLATSTDNTFSHTYENPGTYEVTCTVYDEAEDSVTSEPVTVTVNAPLPTWQDVTEGVRVTHSRPLYDRLHRAFFVLIEVENTSEGALSGPIRMVITDPSIPVKTIEGVGLAPDGVTEDGFPYFIIVPAGESLAPGEGLNGLRVNFELQRRRLTFGVKIEQYPLPQD